MRVSRRSKSYSSRKTNQQQLRQKTPHHDRHINSLRSTTLPNRLSSTSHIPSVAPSQFKRHQTSNGYHSRHLSSTVAAKRTFHSSTSENESKSQLSTYSQSVLDQVPSIGKIKPSDMRVCIVGSGPSAMYTAKYLLQTSPDLHVHIIDQLYTPFGLVRNGIAPDHPEAKNVVNDFTTNVLQHDNAVFIGGVRVKEAHSSPASPVGGIPSVTTEKAHHLHDVSIKDLYQHYHAVVVATGATTGKDLNIPNENIHGVYDSRQFVSWYNGHPDYAQLNPPLSSTKNAVIIGNGNVSLDIARLLIAPPDYLHNTDIPLSVRDTLCHNNAIDNVYICARRGVKDAAYTIAELREILTLVDKTWNTGAADQEANAASSSFLKPSQYSLEFINAIPPTPEEISSNRAVKRKTDVLFQFAQKYHQINTLDASSMESMLSTQPTAADNSDDQHPNESRRTRKLSFVYNATPKEIIAHEQSNDRMSVPQTQTDGDGHNPTNQTHVKAVRFSSTQDPSVEFTLPLAHHSHKSDGGSPVSAPLHQENTIVIKSIGYRTIPLEGLPFDVKRNIYPTDKGRLMYSDSLLNTMNTTVDTSSVFNLAREIYTDLECTNAKHIQKLGDDDIIPSDTTDVTSTTSTQLSPEFAAAGYKILPFIYATGWARRGPTGILGTNIGDAKEVSNTISHDLAAWKRPSTETDIEPARILPSPQALWQKVHTPVADFTGYQNISLYEQEQAFCHGVQSWEQQSQGVQSVHGDKAVPASVKVNIWNTLHEAASGKM